MTNQPWTKLPGEEFTLDFDFTDELPTATTVASGTVTAENVITGLTDESILASTTAVIASPFASFKTIAGVEGGIYRVKMTVTLSNGDIRKGSNYLYVKTP